MQLCITGFLTDDREDDSIQFELVVSPKDEQAVLEVLGWQSLSATSDGELLLTNDQIDGVSAAVKQPLPCDLDLFISVIA